MFNLTNVNAVLAGTELPNYEQKGPYNYTRFAYFPLFFKEEKKYLSKNFFVLNFSLKFLFRAVCTYNVTNDNNYQYSKMIWQPYYLLPGQVKKFPQKINIISIATVCLTVISSQILTLGTWELLKL
jgi:hypothetical protein